MAGQLTAKQAAFVAEYLIDLNASAAARRAGYSPRTANRIGPENLSKPVIAAAIGQAQAERAERTRITADRVLEELAKIGFSNLLDYHRIADNGEPLIDLTNMTRDQAAALTELQIDDYVDGRGDDAREVRRVKIKLADKKSALELIGKHLGMFIERSEVSGPNGGPLQSEVRVYLPENGRSGGSDDE